MTWSYNPSLIVNGGKDAVRLLIGDVLSSDQQLLDEEISYLLLFRGTIYGAAAECCRAMAAKFSRTVDQGAGTSKVAFSQMARAYSSKALEFEQKAAVSGGGIPYAGGISLSDKQLRDMNSDRIQPQFTIGMDDNYLPEPSSGTEVMETFEFGGRTE